MSAVLTFTDRGIYCPAAKAYIDPWKPVDRALITHGHADHARPGMRRYLSTDGAAPVIRHRLGGITLDTVRYGEVTRIGDAAISANSAARARLPRDIDYSPRPKGSSSPTMARSSAWK